MPESNYILEEIKTLREEILDRLRLRVQYEMIAFTLFTSLISFSAILGFSIIVTLIIQVFLFPLISMVTQLYTTALRIGAYIAAKTEVNDLIKDFSWEYLLISQYKEKRRTYFLNISAHAWLFIILSLSSFVYSMFLVHFSNPLVSHAKEVSWDLALVASNNSAKLAISFLELFLFLLNMYQILRYIRSEEIRNIWFKKYKESLQQTSNYHKVLNRVTNDAFFKLGFSAS